ncbi:MAG: FHA domain-containing protein [Cyanobacteria bacterium CRU_2_1]|nr:FHA domain-containing protein [Cyanobacteria bacterium RU_5_0]NJR58875.1 FHA domain-containing protein [Cyanobacteria bacterium CRU_2_1]
MNELTLEWVEAGQVRTQMITDQQPSKSPGTIRIGRDPVRCDLIVQHPTVSGLHVEIFFDSYHNGFYLRNLRDSNPPFVDRQRVTYSAAVLHQGSIIVLGQLEMKVKSIVSALAPTVVTPFHPVPPPQPAAFPQPIPPSQPVAHPIASQPSVPQPIAPQPLAPYAVAPQPVAPRLPVPPPVDLPYGLQCPKCHRVSSYEYLERGCAWCGTSLASAQSVLFVTER